MQSTDVSPETSLSTPLPQALSALHSTVQLPAPEAHNTRPAHAPLALQCTSQSSASQLIWLLHAPSLGHSTLHWLPEH